MAKKIEAIEQTLDKNQITETPKYFEYIKTKGEWENTVKNVPQELSSNQKPNGQRKGEKTQIILSIWKKEVRTKNTSKN